MVEEFKSSYYYRYTGPKVRPWQWNSSGGMDFMLDGLWHKCTKGDGPFASFASSTDPESMWSWSTVLYLIEELTPDQEKRTITLQEGISKLLSEYSIIEVIKAILRRSKSVE